MFGSIVKDKIMSNDHEYRFRRIVRSHSIRYPLMKCADIYKLAYQAAMGSAHGMNSVETAREYFEKEISSMNHESTEPVVDTIAHDGSISRIHIRPYLIAGYSPEKLFEAFLKTGKEYTGSTGKLELYCWWLIRMKKDGMLSDNLRAINQYVDEMSESGYPTVHHSTEYRNAYSPSYRVVASAFMRELNINQ